ncbi:hypothetical protein [Actinoplanes sp. OR16]|uniref:hypothetical protein n=1 Tax=Actinoplanes sp. OR16 TaxID=946334 RepID=UPI000FD7EED9|nr:hypothetical protein [Actinoplanes sp. OR16]
MPEPDRSLADGDEPPTAPDMRWRDVFEAPVIDLDQSDLPDDLVPPATPPKAPEPTEEQA